jgi:hypothetical protein
MRGDSTQVGCAHGNILTREFPQNGFEEQKVILNRLSKQLDEYFALRRFQKPGDYDREIQS